jgi:hypothetical protein
VILIGPYITQLCPIRNIINFAPAQDGKFNVLFKRLGFHPKFKSVCTVRHPNSAGEPHPKTCDHLCKAKQSWARKCAPKLAPCPHMKLLQSVVRTQQDTDRRHLACDSAR